MSLKFMPLQNSPSDRRGNIFFSFLMEDEFIEENDDSGTFVFEQRLPFDTLKAICLFAQPWPDNVCAEGIFWVNSQPDICFRLKIENGCAVTKPAGNWLSGREQYGSSKPNAYEIFTSRPWDPVYGDRVQKVVFRNASKHREYIKCTLNRCLISVKPV
jgi:hypothetical protein